VDGIVFASKAEARRYAELRLLEKAKEIYDLELQPKFPIYVTRPGHTTSRSDKPVTTYIADFRYRRGPRGILTIEDVKGMKTPVYRLKKKLVEAQYGIQIQEIR
jgi:hypothetical protein